MLIQLNQNLENVKIYIYWLTDNRDNYEYKSFQKIVNKFQNCESKIFQSINIILNNIKKIFFKNTYIIITESVYENFISEFLDKMNEINVIPKFIIYTRQKSNKNNNQKNKTFYNYGGRLSSFKEILDFIQKDSIIPNYEISSFSDTLRVGSILYKNKETLIIKQ